MYDIKKSAPADRNGGHLIQYQSIRVSKFKIEEKIEENMTFRISTEIDKIS